MYVLCVRQILVFPSLIQVPDLFDAKGQLQNHQQCGEKLDGFKAANPANWLHATV
jgi:hypothetical protein